MRDATGVKMAASLVGDVDLFFRSVEDRCDFRKGREFRVREPELVAGTITGRLVALQARIAEVVKRTDDEFLKSELQDLGRRIRDARDGMRYSSHRARTNTSIGRAHGKTAQFLSLNAAPIDIAPVLRRMLFRDDCTSVMTSATLAVGRPDLAYFRERIGAHDAQPLLLGSPFQFCDADEGIHRAKKCPIRATLL